MELPISLLRNGVRTQRSYYANGLLKSKRTPHQTVEYKKYSRKCKKPEHVRVRFKNPKNKKAVRVENIRFEFLENCQLSVARKSKDEWIKVTHE